MTRYTKGSSRLLLAFLLVAFGAHSARAQFDTATVLGTVRDTNGAAVGGSTVTLKALRRASP